MELEQPSITSRLLKTFKVNNQQLKFGSYAAELSFYIIWAIIPIMLALANVIAILPISEAEIMQVLSRALPDEVGSVLIPLLESYLTGTSTGVFSLGLIISLWPASNVFNTLQRVLNTVYKVEKSPNFILKRAFAYVFTLAIVFVVAVFSLVMIFGEYIINFLSETFNVRFLAIDFLLEQGWLIGLISFFIILVIIYYFIPNVNWPIKYSIPGALVAMVGFLLVSQLFTLYLAFSSNSTSNSTIGVLIIVVIWLYFNSMVIAIGAYVNVFYHDFKEKSYWKLVEETTHYNSFASYSDNFRQHSSLMPGLKYRIGFESVSPDLSHSLNEKERSE
ncbi:YihY/virulence factor BrkB family protein [Fundicoccus culcitae]|uniref:YihY/virulence factor BrkB family protein n=1 Tax=Fundicoccus culcitae TaxID=2969821 RepID=A0ABY5P6N0_9LACT|nr:YihY/virulence factor BrkB family protein [Fundicoccus culcitae]UUX34063.1 YihY/virulence factor BrkB family protein [Fundicoccus culcitae]